MLIIDQKNIFQIFKNFNSLAFDFLFRSCLNILWYVHTLILLFAVFRELLPNISALWFRICNLKYFLKRRSRRSTKFYLTLLTLFQAVEVHSNQMKLEWCGDIQTTTALAEKFRKIAAATWFTKGFR